MIILAGIIGYSEPALAQRHAGALTIDVLLYQTLARDTIGGGIGAPVFRELPDGWRRWGARSTYRDT